MSPGSLLPVVLLLLFFLTTAGPASARDSRRGPLVGGYEPIKNVNDPHIKDIGMYAVSEHNGQSGQKLVFVRVVRGRQQVVAGMNYDLIIEARDGDVVGRYEALVYERAWEHFRSLVSFKPKA